MKRRRFWFVQASALIGLLAAVLFLAGASASPGTTERVSVDSFGVQATCSTCFPADSLFPALSADGRFVAFVSFADNLAGAGLDTNGAYDIFVRDRLSPATTMVSVASSGVQGNSTSYWPAISGDGRFVAFHSGASNLLPTGVDTNGVFDVFVHDRDTDLDGIFDEAGFVATTRVSVDSVGGQGNGDSLYPAISADGRFVAFESDATNLVGLGVDANGVRDIFVHDRQALTTERVSVDSSSMEGNGFSRQAAINGDGRFVAFESDATNLVGLGVDTNGVQDIFVRDRQAFTTERVSVDSSSVEGNDFSVLPAISGDGRFVAFASAATNLLPPGVDTNNVTDIFVRDRQALTTERVSLNSSATEGNDSSCFISNQCVGISGNGRFVAFDSVASNLDLVIPDTNGVIDTFVHDRQTAATIRVSVDSVGNQGNLHSGDVAISGNGCFVAFDSGASNLDLVIPDTNASSDVFVHDLGDTDGDGECDPFDQTPLGICGGLPVTIAGTPSAETINGTPSGDVIHGFGGNDTIDGMDGNDVICGGDGNDILNGEKGHDTVFGGGGSDTLNGGDGNDTLLGEDDNDTLNGGDGRDKLDGGEGNDTLKGGSGGDTLNGGAGDDNMDGGAHTDTVTYAGATGPVIVDLGIGIAIGEGSDTLATIERVVGSAFDDTLIGGAGNDFLDGAAGYDFLFGDAGNDTLKGGADDDALDGDLGVNIGLFDNCDGGPENITDTAVNCETPPSPPFFGVP